MSAGESWCPVPVDDEPPGGPVEGGRAGRYLIYGPRLGRLYMLPAERAFDGSLQRMLGLSNCLKRDVLHDPVQRIAHDDAGLKDLPRGRASLSLRTGYHAFHRSRRWVPFRVAAALVERAARRVRERESGPDDELLRIGRLMRDLEHQVGIADCYPRALVTAYLCLLAGRECTLTIGVLAPTRKMHAWCSTQGLLPYEPLPEHYLYRPVWSKTLAS